MLRHSRLFKLVRAPHRSQLRFASVGRVQAQRMAAVIVPVAVAEGVNRPSSSGSRAGVGVRCSVEVPVESLDDLLVSFGLAGPPAQGRVLMEGVLAAELFADDGE
jgi:hypothetical protein